MIVLAEPSSERTSKRLSVSRLIAEESTGL